MSIARIRDKNVTFEPQALAAEQRNPRRLVMPRRAVLRGAAACIGLPLLESLWSPSEARAQTASPPIRWVSWFIPCGVWGPSWFPTNTGVNYTLSSTLASLAPVKSKVIVFAGVENLGLSGGPAVNSQGSHGCGPPGSTTCVQGQKPNITMGISVDQVYAQSLNNATRIQSMQLSGTDGTFSDVQYPAVYNGTTSWSSATQPLPPLVNAGLVFDQIFAGGAMTSGNAAAQAAVTQRLTLRKSVLDGVLGEANTLIGKLGATDQLKVNEYLAAVRAAEIQVQNSALPSSCSAGTMARPTLTVGTDTNGFGLKLFDPPTYTDTITTLMSLAFQCDATRVINYQQMNGGHSSYGSFPWLTPAITRDHHSMSHHNGDATVGALLARVEAWEISMFSSFLQKLDAISEGSGTLLDNSLIFLSNELSDGNAHNQTTTTYANFSGPTGKPILLAGTAGGKIVSGRHIAYTPGQANSQANLYIALLNTLGVPVKTFGAAGTAPITGLTSL
jgi:hypothetical protein